MSFTWEVPTRIHFGTNVCAEALAKEKERIRDRNVLLIYTGRTLRDNGTLDKVRGWLRENGCANVLVYAGHGANPEVSEAEEAGRLIREQDIGLLAALGGGSAIDLAKGAAVAAAGDAGLGEYLENGLPAPDDVLPLIAMPTTAGSGSELSKAAILSDSGLQMKDGIRGASLAPEIAIVDAAFTWSMPKKLTMESGFDALAHAIESYMSQKANPFSEMLSLQAIRLIGGSLPKLKQDLENHEARERMSYASMMMGMNLYNVGNCLPHRMQYPIGAMTGTSHAAGLAAIYPAWIREEYKACPERITAIFHVLGKEIPESAKDAGDIVAHFLADLGIQHTLSELGVKESDTKRLIREVRGNLLADRVARDEEAMERIYRNSMD